MEKQKLYNALYDKSNIDMIYNICLKKIKQTVPREDYKVISENYDNMFFDVMNTIFKEELKIERFYSKENVIKINNIVIKEAYNYIIHLSKKQEMSTNIDTISEESDEYIDELKRENNSKPQEIEKDVPVPIFNEDVYEIDSSMMVNDNNIYSSDIYIPNTKSVELIQVRIDRSEYMITEYSNKVSLNGKIVEMHVGNYNEKEFADFFQRLLDLHVNSNKENIMSVLINFEKRRDIFVINYKRLIPEKDKSFEDFIIDFTVENSIGNILGFDNKKYQMRIDTEIEGKKHKLGYSTEVYCDIEFTQDIKTKLCIPLDVSYNETKFYVPEYKKIMFGKEPIFTIDNIKISLKDCDGKPYNTRERKFYIRFKAITLI